MPELLQSLTLALPEGNLVWVTIESYSPNYGFSMAEMSRCGLAPVQQHPRPAGELIFCSQRVKICTVLGTPCSLFVQYQSLSANEVRPNSSALSLRSSSPGLIK